MTENNTDKIQEAVDALACIEHLYVKRDRIGVYRIAVDVGCNSKHGCLLPQKQKTTAEELKLWKDAYQSAFPKKANKSCLRNDGFQSVRIVEPPKALD